MVVAPNGDVLVIGNPFATNAEAGGARSGGSLMLLRDANGDGKAELMRTARGRERLGHRARQRIPLHVGRARDRALHVRDRRHDARRAPDTIVSGIATGGHTAYNFVDHRQRRFT